MGLVVHIVETAPIEENCYILEDEATSEGLIIDPGNDAEEILAEVKAHNLKICAIVLTHGHWDHIGALDKVRKALGAKAYIHKEDAAMLTDGRSNLSAFMLQRYDNQPAAADGFLEEGDVVDCGESKLKVIHTPGHTRGGICLYDAENRVLFSGDSLFRGEIGRCDFPGGSLPLLVGSLKEKLMVLPPETKVYPGHGPSSIIGWERKNNPYCAVE